MKNIVIITFVLLIAAVALGCTASVPVEEQVTESATDSVSGVSNEMVDSTNTESASTTRTIEITARKWEFIPNIVQVNQGDMVKLIVTSMDVEHGFALPEFGVNEQLLPQKTVEVQFVADKKGTFSFFCSVFCGDGHGDMRGQLIVR